MTLVLASRSRTRAQMLADADVEVVLRPGEVDEASVKTDAQREGLGPLPVAERLAALKALAAPYAGDDLVIGADQTLDLDGVLFDKPPTLQAAADQLRQLRGRSHRLHAAVALARGGEVVWSYVDTAVLTVRPFTDDYLKRYIAREGGALLSCVGAYRLEGLGAQLFERLEGDYFTVLGMPLLPLLQALRTFRALAS